MAVCAGLCRIVQVNSSFAPVLRTHIGGKRTALVEAEYVRLLVRSLQKGGLLLGDPERRSASVGGVHAELDGCGTAGLRGPASAL